jgi:hypothetical protein
MVDLQKKKKVLSQILFSRKSKIQLTNFIGITFVLLGYFLFVRMLIALFLLGNCNTSGT